MHDGSLVGAATNHIYGDGNHHARVQGQYGLYLVFPPTGRKGCSHHTEHAARSQTASIGIHGGSTTCRRAANFEEVRAFIHGADEGSCGHVWSSVTVTKKGHDSRLSARRDIGTSHVIVVRARRAIGIIKDEFAAAEERFGCLLPVYDRELSVYDEQIKNLNSATGLDEDQPYPMEYILSSRS